ncbi:MAG: lysylphosphatidylglycerol synthase transmembrane domain-containing protein [Planctomycetota bacterium]
MPESDFTTLAEPSVSSVPNPLRSILIRIGKILFKVAFVGGIFCFLINIIQMSDLRDLAKRWPWVLVSIALYFVAMLSCSLRYKLLLRALDMHSRFRDVFSFSMIAGLFYLVWWVVGDLVKAYYVFRSTRAGSGKPNIGLIVLSVFLDRIVGFFALLTLGFIVSIVAWPQLQNEPNLRRLVLLFAGVCAGALVFFFIMVSEKLENSPLRKRLMQIVPFHQKLEAIYAGFAGLRHHKPILAAMLGLSILNHIIVCVIMLLLMQGVTFTSAATGLIVAPEAMPSALSCLTVLPLGFFLSTFGMAFGFGVGTVAFELLFQRLLGIGGVAKMVLAFQIVGLLFRLLGIPFWLLYRRKAGVETMESRDA